MLVISAVGAACVAATAAGGYLATRLTSADPAPATVPPPTSSAAAPGDTSVAVIPAPVEPAAPAPAPAPAQPVRERASSDRRVEERAPAARRETIPAKVNPAPNRPYSTNAPRPAPAPASTTPNTSASQPSSTWSSSPEPVSSSATPVDVPVSAPPAPPKRQFDELTVTTDSVIGIRLDAPVSSETAKVEDRVTARVTRNVTVDEKTAIPSGTRLEGTVTSVQRGGKFKERARIGVQFTTMILPDNTRMPIRTETIYREGDSPTSEATSKIGASAVVGAILGAVIGGKKGAAIGTTAGAAGGTAVVMAGNPNEAVISAGTPLTLRLTAPVTVTIEREQN